MDTRKEYTKPTIESGVLEQTSLTCNINQEWSGAVAPFWGADYPDCLWFPADYAKNGAFGVKGICDWLIWGADNIVAFS